MTKKLIVILLMLSGCTTNPPLIDREIAYIPVSSCVSPPDFPQIQLPISVINEKTTTQEIVKLYAATVELLLGELKTRDIVLNAYRNQSKDIKEDEFSNSQRNEKENKETIN